MSLKKRSDRRVAVGGLITAAIFLALAAIIVISGQEGLLRSRYELRTRMDRVNGLQVGAPVWLAGVNVGSVSDIIFFNAGKANVTKIEVRMKIKKSIQHLIRSDSKARIGTLGLLGDKYIALTLGSQDSIMLEDKNYICSTNPVDFEELITRSVGVVDDITETAVSVKNIAKKVDNGTGTLGKLINEPLMYFDLTHLLNLVQRLTDKVNNNEGTIGLLFNNPSLYHHLDTTLMEISSLTDTIKRGQGTLKKLLKDSTLYNNMVSSIAKIDSLVEQIQTGQGTTGALISNKELYNKLVSSVVSLDSLVQDIKKNPGKYLKVKVSLF